MKTHADRMIGKGYWSLSEHFYLDRVSSYTDYVGRRLSHDGCIKPLNFSTPHPDEEVKSGRSTPYVASWARPRAQKVIVAEGNKCRIWTPATGEFSELLDRRTALELVST